MYKDTNIHIQPRKERVNEVFMTRS